MAFGVTVDFNANVAKFDGQINKLSGRLDKFGKRTESSFGLAKKAVAGFVAIASTVQFTQLITSSVNAGDKLQKLAIRLGSSTEALSELEHVANLSGVSFDTLTISLQRMTRRVSEAANETGEAVKALDELGLSAKDLEKLAPEDQFELIADSISQIKNPADKVRLAMKLFDSDGVSLLQTMTSGANGIRQMRNEAKRFGLTLTTDATNKMADFNDSITRMEARFGGLRVSLVNKFVPVLDQLINQFSQLLDSVDVAFNKAEKRAQKNSKSGRNKNTGNKSLSDLFDVDTGKGSGRRNANRRNRLARQSLVVLPSPEVVENKAITGTSFAGNSSAKKSTKKGLVSKKQIQLLQQATGPASEWNKLLQEADSIIQQTKTPLENLNKEIELYSILADRGLISQEVLNRALTEAGQNFNDLTGDVEVAADQMTVFADQAARNMQDAFADFLFDPFDDGLDGMLKGFTNIARQMAAEFAAQEIFRLVGSGVSSAGGVGGIFSSLIGSIGFADGGIMSSAGKLPLNSYASGGIANSPQLALFGEGRMNEAYVPLPDGKRIPVALSGGSGGNVYNISVSVKSTDNEPASQTGQKIAETMMRVIAKQEIQNQKRAGNALNPTTKFA